MDHTVSGRFWALFDSEDRIGSGAYPQLGFASADVDANAAQLIQLGISTGRRRLAKAR
jgi:hypothetical protein